MDQLEILERDALEQIGSLRRLVFQSLLTMLFALFSTSAGLAWWASSTHDDIRAEVAIVREGAAGAEALRGSSQRDLDALRRELDALEQRFDDRLRAQETIVTRLETLVGVLAEIVERQERGSTSLRTTPFVDPEA